MKRDLLLIAAPVLLVVAGFLASLPAGLAALAVVAGFAFWLTGDDA